MYIIDTTLREGVQMPGLAFAPDVAERVASLLAQTGLDELGLGVVTADSDTAQDVARAMAAARRSQE